MLLTRTSTGWIVDGGQGPRALANEHAAGLTTREDLAAFLRGIAPGLGPASTGGTPLPPLDQQEVWAAGVTYFRSRTARMEESKASDGGRFYDLVYNAERPELFFKASPWRVVGSGATVRIRRDARWNVPEPEFALLISPKGAILGYMCGNDMSSRDIEGENPLYLPQAKVYDGSCALGPSIFVTDAPLPSSTAIRLDIARAGATVFAGATSVAEMKRDFATLVRYLYQELSFPHGAVLLTGTGVIPPDDFTLQSGDRVRITIDAVGTLDNTVQ